MDESRQPEINVDAILLKESVFRRLPVIPDDLKMNISFSVANNFTDDGRRLVTELSCKINDEGAPVELFIAFIGVFSSIGNANMSLEQFSKVNASAMILPYIREEIHSRFTKASLSNLAILPPINLQALFEHINLQQSKKPKDY